MSETPITFTNEIKHVEKHIAHLLGSDLGPEQSQDVMQMTNGIGKLVALIDKAYAATDPLLVLSQDGHAMRNALNGTFGHSMVLVDFPYVHPKEHLTSEQIATVRRIYQHTENLLYLITEINIYAKLQRDQFPVATFVPTQLMQIMERLAGEFKVVFTTEITDDTMFHTDAVQLYHALQALVRGVHRTIGSFPTLTLLKEGICVYVEKQIPALTDEIHFPTSDLMETPLNDLQLHNSVRLLQHMGTTLRQTSPNSVMIQFPKE